MDNAQLASAIASVATLHGKFRLRSGAVATTYFDKYRFESDPALLGALAEALAERGIERLSLFTRSDLEG
jgi:orotate phosphoribosyltransferase